MSEKKPSRQSLIALDAANFFLAELLAVVGPFLAVYLKSKGWSYSQIGVAMASGGFGSLLLQIPAGLVCDRIPYPRMLLASACLVMGLCFAGIPMHAEAAWWVILLLFFTGVANAFFIPLLNTLALALVGSKGFAEITGRTQSWNHLGNITSAVAAVAIVHKFGVETIFFIMAAVSILTIGAALAVRRGDLKHLGKNSEKKDSVFARLKAFSRDPQARVLLLAVTCFHLSNTPVLPLLSLYLKQLGGNDTNVAFAVLIAQAVMVPTAIIASKYCSDLGRKPVFMIAFIILPIRIVLYTLSKDTTVLLSIQALDGMASGIYYVAIALVCEDITRRIGGFNTLLAAAQTALAFGGFVGPLAQGFFTDKIGFKATFLGLAAIGLVGAIIFGLFMTETKDQPSRA